MSEIPAGMIWIDPDFRRDPKTDHYCVRCQRDLKPGQPFRMVCLAFEGFYVWDPAIHSVDPTGETDMGLHPVGMDCARKIGIKFTYDP